MLLLNVTLLEGVLLGVVVLDPLPHICRVPALVTVLRYQSCVGALDDPISFSRFKAPAALRSWPSVQV